MKQGSPQKRHNRRRRNAEERIQPPRRSRSDIGTSRAIRVCIAEANPLVRLGLTTVLRGYPGLQILSDTDRMNELLPSVRQLHQALPEDACFLPSGAGGGDVSLFVGLEGSPASFRNKLRDQGIRPLSLGLDAASSGLVLEADRG